ncbi:hypothetical protein [Arthrobacter sp. HLT1-21]
MKLPNLNPASRMANGALFDKQGKPKPGIQRTIERAIEVQRPLVLANLRRMYAKNPQATAAEISSDLERHYLTVITVTGAGVGATAVVPAIGTIASLGLSAAATVGFLEATALYAQSIAELHGVQTGDPERARTMVMAILMGEEGNALIQAMLRGSGGGATEHWGTVVGGAVPSPIARTIGNSIRRRFVRKMLAKQGGALLGRAIPFGIGAVVGGAGNHMMGRAVVAATAQAFGPAPSVLPGELVQDLDR